jgi:hypothetical protein
VRTIPELSEWGTKPAGVTALSGKAISGMEEEEVKAPLDSSGTAIFGPEEARRPKAFCAKV